MQCEFYTRVGALAPAQDSLVETFWYPKYCRSGGATLWRVAICFENFATRKWACLSATCFWRAHRIPRNSKPHTKSWITFERETFNEDGKDSCLSVKDVLESGRKHPLGQKNRQSISNAEPAWILAANLGRCGDDIQSKTFPES
jgi:hypothetical protein